MKYVINYNKREPKQRIWFEGRKIMRFCTNCGKENDGDAVFCIGCGTNMASASGTAAAGQPGSGSPAMTEQPKTGGAYYPSGTQGAPSGAYYQPGIQGTPITYNQPGAQGAPGTYAPPVTQGAPGTPYSPPGTQGIPNAPYYQTGAPGTPGAPYYQNGPYNSGGPNYPGGGPGKNNNKNNKTTVIIVSVIIGLCLIAGGIFAYITLSNKAKDNNNTSLSGATDNAAVTSMPSSDVNEASVEPSIVIVPDASASVAPSSSEGLDLFDSVTQDNVIAACEETGMDISKITDVQLYGTWFEGDVYTFLYDDSVIDILLYDDGTVFSLETNGVQIYLKGYESYLIDDYLGYTTHFDESYPANGYAFYVNGNDVDSTVKMETGYDFDYVIEFVDANDDNLALAFYMQAGSTLSIGVPTGDYYIQYAAGAEWQGVDYLFGQDDTVFYQSDSIYSFYPENDSTITLDINGGAGIASSEITIDDFH